MNRIFEPKGYFTVPDGTDVSAFLNASDSTQDLLPGGAIGDMSIASGRIEPGVESWIHCLPLLAQVTYVVSGHLTVRMRDPGDREPYRLELVRGQAAVTRPGTFLQLQNEGDIAAEVLYIVSPSFVFEKEGEDILYDDAVLVAQSWDEPAATNSSNEIMKTAHELRARRAKAKRRLAARKRS